MMQRKEAVNERNLEWLLTFEEWWKIWQDSGHWEERGSLGYHMCRFGDEGPYSITNVYIAFHTQNKKDQQENGHGTKPPVHRKITEDSLNKLIELRYSDTANNLAKQFGISENYVYWLRWKHRC